MSSPADVIYQILINNAIGVASADSGSWPIYVAFAPAQPDSLICVHDTAGMPDGRLMRTGERIEHPGIMIYIRGQVYPTTWDKAKEIALLLDSVVRLSVAIDSNDAYLVHNISRTGTINPLGVEEEGDRRRHQFTVNAIVTIESE